MGASRIRDVETDWPAEGSRIHHYVGLWPGLINDNTAVALIKNKALKPGTVLLELLYVSEVVAPRALQVGRYLPPAALRCLRTSRAQS